MPKANLMNNDEGPADCSDIEGSDTKTNISTDTYSIGSLPIEAEGPLIMKEKCSQAASDSGDEGTNQLDGKTNGDVHKQSKFSRNRNATVCNGTTNCINGPYKEDESERKDKTSTSKKMTGVQIKSEGEVVLNRIFKENSGDDKVTDQDHFEDSDAKSSSTDDEIKPESEKQFSQKYRKSNGRSVNSIIKKDDTHHCDDNGKKRQTQNEQDTFDSTSNDLPNGHVQQIKMEQIKGTKCKEMNKLDEQKKDEDRKNTDNGSLENSGNDSSKNDEEKDKVSAQDPKVSSQNSDGRSHVGRKGDPRMHASVAAKISNPMLKLYEALIQGGFKYESDKDAEKDKDGVTLVQRKNQLRRRLRKLNIPRDNKFTKKSSFAPVEENNSTSGSLKKTDQPMDNPIFPINMYYQPPHMIHMPQQFGYNIFPGASPTPQQCAKEKQEANQTTQPKENANNPKPNFENPNDCNRSESVESKPGNMMNNHNKIPDYSIPPYLPSSAFGFPSFHPHFPIPPMGFNLEGKGQIKNNINGDSIPPITNAKVSPTDKNDKETDTEDILPSYTNDKAKLNKSCDRCRKRKVKCDGNDPCVVCINDRARLRKKAEKQEKGVTFGDDYDFGISCIYSFSMKRGPPAGRNKKRRKKEKDKEESSIKPSQSSFPGINISPGGPQMITPQIMPLYSQFPHPTPMMNNIPQPNVSTSPHNQAQFGMNYPPPYPFPFTNNPVTDGIYSQAILAAARSVLMPPGSKSDEPENDEKKTASSSNQTDKDQSEE